MHCGTEPLRGAKRRGVTILVASLLVSVLAARSLRALDYVLFALLFVLQPAVDLALLVAEVRSCATATSEQSVVSPFSLVSEALRNAGHCVVCGWRWLGKEQFRRGDLLFFGALVCVDGVLEAHVRD